jgi:hypothetical protein
MKFALLFLIITFATALPIYDVPSRVNTSIANIPLHNKTSRLYNSNNSTNTNNNTITRTLLSTIDDISDSDDNDELVGNDNNQLVGNSGKELVGNSGKELVGNSGKELVGNSGKELVGKELVGKELVGNVGKVEVNKSVVVSSHEQLTSYLHVYHNHTTHHLKNLEIKIIAMLKKTRQTQKEEELDNKKNYENEKKILLNKKLERQKYEQTLLSLHQQIVNLNKTILEYWSDIHSDTTYLQKLKLLKPKFTSSVDKVNNEMTVLNKYITETIIEGDDKKEMLSMLFNIKNTTYYSSNDLAEAFLHHYEKYKNQLGKDTSSYHTEIEKLSSLITHYKLVASKIHDIDYTEIVHIVKKLKNVYKLSKENTQLLDDLIYKIISILKNKTCSAKSFTSSTKECSLELLKSHIANKLV